MNNPKSEFTIDQMRDIVEEIDVGTNMQDIANLLSVPLQKVTEFVNSEKYKELKSSVDNFIKQIEDQRADDADSK